MKWHDTHACLEYENIRIIKTSILAFRPLSSSDATVFQGDLKLFESGAILLHLASKYGGLSQDQLSKAMQWSLFANSTMSPAFFNNRSQVGCCFEISGIQVTRLVKVSLPGGRLIQVKLGIILCYIMIGI